MTSKSKNNQEIKDAFDQLSKQLSASEKLENQANLLMFQFLSVVEARCKELGWKRKQLAEKIGTSASYITQLFRGDKQVNFVTLAKFQKVLGIEFEITGKGVISDNKVTDKRSYLNSMPFPKEYLISEPGVDFKAEENKKQDPVKKPK